LIFTKIGTDNTPKSKNEFVGVNIAPPLLFCFQEVLKIHANINIVIISSLNVHESPKFLSFGKSGWRNMMVTSNFRSEAERLPFCACAVKIMQYNAYLYLNCKNSHIL